MPIHRTVRGGRYLLHTRDPIELISGFVRIDVFRPHVMQVIVAALLKAGLPD
jgi:hypothetical protein